MTADITQLCDLIAEPTEPLALRLSSNLMYGVVRVYKVKQELFMSDVNTCVISLKKMMHDMHNYVAAEADLLLAQSTARPHTVTIQPDPGMARALMFDPLFSGWGNDTDDEGNMAFDSDEDFNPRKKQKKDERGKPAKESIVEVPRRDVHTLNEHHDHLLSTPLDGSFETGFSAGPAGLDLTSSQIDGRPIFGDNFFDVSDGFDLAVDLGEELAKELGWEVSGSPIEPDIVMDFDASVADFDTGMNFADTSFELKSAQGGESAFMTSTQGRTPRNSQRKSNQENTQPALPEDDGMASSVISISRAFLSQRGIDEEEGRQPLADITAVNQQADKPARKRKRARLLLDARTELTDEELKEARARYLESQSELRREIERRKLEKDASKLVDDLIWGAPRGLHAEPLVQFWQDNLHVQAQARANTIDIHHDSGLPKKRRRKRKERTEWDMTEDSPAIPPAHIEDFGMDSHMGHDVGMGFDPFGGEVEEARRRSSEEPGQGRQRSRASSVVRGSQFGVELEPVGSTSQKSMFPWDNAGVSSSANGGVFDDNIELADVDIRLRSSSLGGRGSPLQYWSRSGSMVAGITGLSPAPVGQIIGEDLTLDDDHIQESQRTDVALIALEKSSFNFLEYAKMQHQAKPNDNLTFDAIVPSATSTKHVVSAAFYHCLVLATKNLVSLKQEDAYGPVIISIV